MIWLQGITTERYNHGHAPASKHFYTGVTHEVFLNSRVSGIVQESIIGVRVVESVANFRREPLGAVE